MTNTCLLIDADSCLYKAGFKAQRNWHTVVDENTNVVKKATTDKKEVNKFVKDSGEASGYTIISETEIDPISYAYQNFDTLMDYVLRKTNPDSYELFLSGEGNFRKELATIQPYKGHRDPLAKPYYFNTLYDYAVSKWGATIVEGEEAEDRISIIQCKERTTTIAHIDKDLDQVPGWHYNYDTDMGYYLDADAANFWFYCQILAGDSVDNIRGIPRIGMATAQKILMPYYGLEDEMWIQCEKAYENAGIPDDVLETAQLVRIRRYENEIWVPPGMEGQKTQRKKNQETQRQKERV